MLLLRDWGCMREGLISSMDFLARASCKASPSGRGPPGGGTAEALEALPAAWSGRTVGRAPCARPDLSSPWGMGAAAAA
jgi:hypothetical protein